VITLNPGVCVCFSRLLALAVGALAVRLRALVLDLVGALARPTTAFDTDPYSGVAEANPAAGAVHVRAAIEHHTGTVVGLGLPAGSAAVIRALRLEVARAGLLPGRLRAHVDRVLPRGLDVTARDLHHRTVLRLVRVADTRADDAGVDLTNCAVARPAIGVPHASNSRRVFHAGVDLLHGTRVLAAVRIAVGHDTVVHVVPQLLPGLGARRVGDAQDGGDAQDRDSEKHVDVSAPIWFLMTSLAGP
jgi:hypothetical protein